MAYESELSKLCAAKGVKIKSIHKGYVSAREDKELRGGPGWEHDAWTVTLSYQGRKLQTSYNTGMAHTDKDPDVADVLSSVLSDSRDTDLLFEDWAGDLGYDPDSIKALKVFKACKRLAPKVSRLLGADFEVFRKAEH